MKKNVYSLVLSEGVVDAIDRLAYRNNTNRSNMINQILAEYVSYVTPEKRMQEILKQVESLLHGQDTFQVMLGASSDSMLSLRSALAYKYNPTVRYSVELYRTPSEDGAVGALKVSLRTQNSGLILAMQGFYQTWIALEQHYKEYMATRGTGDIRSNGDTRSRSSIYTIDGGRMIREFQGLDAKGERLDGQALGKAIAHYVQVLDQCMKVYFYRLDDPDSALREMETRYVRYLQQGQVL